MNHILCSRCHEPVTAILAHYEAKHGGVPQARVLGRSGLRVTDAGEAYLDDRMFLTMLDAGLREGWLEKVG